MPRLAFASATVKIYGGERLVAAPPTLEDAAMELIERATPSPEQAAVLRRALTRETTTWRANQIFWALLWHEGKATGERREPGRRTSTWPAITAAYEQALSEATDADVRVALHGVFGRIRFERADTIVADQLALLTRKLYASPDRAERRGLVDVLRNNAKLDADGVLALWDAVVDADDASTLSCDDLEKWGDAVTTALKDATSWKADQIRSDASKKLERLLPRLEDRALGTAVRLLGDVLFHGGSEQTLIDLTGHTDGDVRRAAVAGLSRVGARGSEQARRVLATEGNWSVLSEAWDTLEKLGDARIEIVRTASSNPHVATVAGVLHAKLDDRDDVWRRVWPSLPSSLRDALDEHWTKHTSRRRLDHPGWWDIWHDIERHDRAEPMRAAVLSIVTHCHPDLRSHIMSTTTARSPCRRAWCLLIAALVLIAAPPAVLAQDRCSAQTRCVISIQPEGPTLIRVQLQDDDSCRVSVESNGQPGSAPSRDFTLDLSDGPRRTLILGDGARCDIDFEREWDAIEPANSVVRFSGSSIASIEVERLLFRRDASGSAVERGALSRTYRLLAVPLAQGAPATARTEPCSPRAAESWSPGSRLPIPDGKGQGYDLLLAQGNAATGRCYRLGTALRDERKVVIKYGNHLAQFDLDAWPPSPLPIFEDTEPGPQCWLDLGAGGRVQLDCNNIVVPAVGKLQALSLPTVRYRVRVIGTLSHDACPNEPGQVGQNVVSLRPEARLCFYRQTQGGAYEGVGADELTRSGRDSFRFSVCANTSGVNCGSSANADDRVALPTNDTEGALLRIHSGHHSEPIRSILGPLRLFPALEFTVKEAPVEYVAPADLLNALLSPTATDLLCLTPPGGSRMSGSPPQEYLSIRIDGSKVNVPDGWEVRGRRDKLCAKKLTFNGDEVHRLRERFDRGDEIEVTYLQDSSPVLRRRLRSNRHVSIRSVSTFGEGAKSTEVGEPRTKYAVAREPLDLGGWLCVETQEKVGDTIPIQLARLGIRDGAGGQRVGRFVSGQNAEAAFVFKGASDGRMRYCVSLSSEGRYGVRFAPEATATTAQGALAFSLDDDIRGCDSDSGYKQDCGRIEPDWKWFAYGGDALRFSHIDIGVWRTTDAATRLRVTPIISLVDAGVGVPNVVSITAQTGFGIPFTLLTSSSTESATAPGQPERTFAGIGLGGFVGLCVKAHTALVPRVCGGAMGDLNADIVQKDGSDNEVAGTALATYFFSIGGGLH